MRRPRKSREAAVKAWYSRLGDRVRTFREERQLTREALAVQSGLSANTILNAESGRSGQLETYVCLAEHLDLSPSVLLSVPDELAARYGIRDFTTALATYGYYAAHHHMEARLRPDGSAVVVNSVSRLRSSWYKGPVSVCHKSGAAGEQAARIGVEEAPLEILEVHGDLAFHADRLSLTDKKGQAQIRTEIEFPNGLGAGYFSYRHATAFSDGVFLPCAELALWDGATISDEEMPAALAGLARKYAAMKEDSRRRLAGTYLALCVTEFPVESLLVSVRFPAGCFPQYSEVRCWSGSGPWSPDRSLPEVARRLRIAVDDEAPALRLAVDKPAMGVSYAMYWLPPRFAQWWAVYKEFKGL